MKSSKNEIAFPAEDVFGFAGAIQTNSYRESTGKNALTPEAARRLWNRACAAVTEVFGEADPAVIENFLRSANGRHLANETFNEANADIDSLGDAIAKTLGRKVKVRKRLGGYGEKMVWKKQFEDSRRATLNNR